MIFLRTKSSIFIAFWELVVDVVYMRVRQWNTARKNELDETCHASIYFCACHRCDLNVCSAYTMTQQSYNALKDEIAPCIRKTCREFNCF